MPPEIFLTKKTLLTAPRVVFRTENFCPKMTVIFGQKRNDGDFAVISFLTASRVVFRTEIFCPKNRKLRFFCRQKAQIFLTAVRKMPFSDSPFRRLLSEAWAAALCGRLSQKAVTSHPLSRKAVARVGNAVGPFLVGGCERPQKKREIYITRFNRELDPGSSEIF